MRITALGGEAATLVRASDATVADSFGTSRTVGWHQSAWTSVSDLPYLELSRAAGARAADLLSWPFLATPQAMTLYIRFIEAGTVALANARVLTIGSSVLGTPYLLVSSDGTTYRATHHNGSTAVTAAAVAAPTNGQRVELRVVLNSDGSIAIAQSINEAAESALVTSSVSSLAAMWSSTTLWLNGEAAATAGIGLYRTLKIAAGVRSLADCRGRLF